MAVVVAAAAIPACVTDGGVTAAQDVKAACATDGGVTDVTPFSSGDGESMALTPKFNKAPPQKDLSVCSTKHVKQK